jgi:hypothetical protein
LSALTALCGALLFRFGVDGWQMWIVGAGLVIASAAILRRWSHYELTRDELTVQNDIRDARFNPCHSMMWVTLRSNKGSSRSSSESVHWSFARALRIGCSSCRGVVDPETMKLRIRASA